MNVVPAVAIVLIAIALAVVARPTKVFAAVIFLSILVSTVNYLLYTPPVQLFFFAVILFAAVFISAAIIIEERGITPGNRDALCSSISRLIKIVSPEISIDALMRGIVIMLVSAVIGSTLYYAILQWLRAPIIAALLTTPILATSGWLTVKMLKKRGLDVAVLTLTALAMTAIPQVQPFISEAFSGIDESMRYIEVVLSALG